MDFLIYVEKSEDTEDLRKTILTMYPQARVDIKLQQENQTKGLACITQTETALISFEQILFLMSDKHYVEIITLSRKFRMRTKLSDIWKSLPKEKFLRIHRSYIVNMQHIRGIEGTWINLENGESIPVSRAYIAEVRESFLNYIKGVFGC